jgi:hypothetical protein
MRDTSGCREEERRVDHQQNQSRWRPTRRQLLWASGIAALAFLIVVVGGYAFPWDWTGFGQYKVNGEVQPFKSLWDWLDLLVVPIVLALGGYLFNRSESRRTQKSTDEQRKLDRRIADERRQDDTLQAYLDGMAQLLTDKDRPLHRAQPGDSLSTVARARTLTVLPRLDGERKGSVLQFLFESRLIDNDHKVLNRYPLKEADLREVDLFKAHLIMADLIYANLSYANLHGADLRGANLESANLERAYLGEADLKETKLSGADLSGADLTDAKGVTNQELERQALRIEGATMPDGQKYEDWLKSKDRAENGKNDGLHNFS